MFHINKKAYIYTTDWIEFYVFSINMDLAYKHHLELLHIGNKVFDICMIAVLEIVQGRILYE